MFSVMKLAPVFLLALLPSLSAADSADSKLLAEGRVDDAIASLQRRISSTPKDAESYNLLCRAHFTLSDWDKGIAACEKAISLDPENAQYHLWLGRIYGEKADHSRFLSAAGLAGKVRNEFETAVRLNPNSAEARTDLAEFYLEAPAIVGGGRDKAEAQAQKLSTMDPVKAGWVKKGSLKRRRIWSRPMKKNATPTGGGGRGKAEAQAQKLASMDPIKAGCVRDGSLKRRRIWSLPKKNIAP